MKKIFKNILIIFIYVVVILYLLELLVTLFLPSKVSQYIDPDYQRYSIAKKMGVPYDTRTYYKAFFDEKKNEPTLAPRYQFTSAYWSNKLYGPDNPFQNFIKQKIELKSIIPLRGPVDKKTLSCNEGGLRKIANNDKFGFKNKNLIYKNKIKFFLIGDSFTHGECEDENTDIAGFLRNNFNLNAANYGISGGGPLLSLASLSEYAVHFKPEYSIYFYSEANDMQDLRDEKETFLLKYLNSFTQDLFNKQNDINSFFADYEKIAYKLLEYKLKNEPTKFDENFINKIKDSEDKKIKEIIKDFFELQKLKNILFSKSFYFNVDNSIDQQLFTQTLKKMKSLTAQWGGKFIVVYLPDWNRFNSKYSLVKFLHKRKIEKIINAVDVEYIDITKEFNKENNPIEFYPFGLRGHYTPRGYELIAKSIYEKTH